MTKILLTGATGYIGGSILSALLEDNHEGVSYGVLIRNAKAATVYEARDITPHLFQGLDDLETIERVAAEYDGAFWRNLPDARNQSQRILTRGLLRSCDQHGFGKSPRVSKSSHPRPCASKEGEGRRNVHHPCQQFPLPLRLFTHSH